MSKISQNFKNIKKTNSYSDSVPKNTTWWSLRVQRSNFKNSKNISIFLEVKMSKISQNFKTKNKNKGQPQRRGRDRANPPAPTERQTNTTAVTVGCVPRSRGEGRGMEWTGKQRCREVQKVIKIIKSYQK